MTERNLVPHAAYREMREERDSLLAQVERLRAVLLGYERWEAPVLLESRGRPWTEAYVLNQTHINGLLRLQAERNAAMAPRPWENHATEPHR